MSDATVKVLLVDDDEVDVTAFKRAFKRQRIANPIVHVGDGIEALDRLRGTAGHERLERPYVIVLDLNMPRMGGLELLEQLRADEDLRDAVVFVLTTSNRDMDRVEAYRLNVAGYLLKSDPAGSFLETVGMLDHYWRVVELP